MRGVRAGLVIACILLGVCGSEPTSAETLTDSRDNIGLATVARGLDRPTAIAFRPADPTIYVALQRGLVVGVRDGAARPVLRLREPASLEFFQGLLGIAFSPDGAHLYVHFTTNAKQTSIEEYAVVDNRESGVRADPSTRRRLLIVQMPGDNFPHFGGQLAFGPDELLYIALGDGGLSDGYAGDSSPGHAPQGNGQSLDTLLGKILRVDPTPDGELPYTIPPQNPFASGGGRPEICDWGLRNPWKFSFDAATGDLWVGDVGDTEVEEINRLPASEPCGANFGWPVLEGDQPYRGGTLNAALGKVIAPVAVQRHPSGACAVIAGYVYRGSELPDLVGSYIFSDLCDRRLRTFDAADAPPARVHSLGVQIRAPVAFGQDDANELYVLTCAGCDSHVPGKRDANRVYRLTAQ